MLVGGVGGRYGDGDFIPRDGLETMVGVSPVDFFSAHSLDSATSARLGEDAMAAGGDGRGGRVLGFTTGAVSSGVAAPS